MAKLASARAVAQEWMNDLGPGASGRLPFGQRPQALVEAGGGRYEPGLKGDGTFPNAKIVGGQPNLVPVMPVEIVKMCTFADGTQRTIEDAVTMKAYNSATRHYVFWNNTSKQWAFDRTNAKGFNYVERVCAEVEK